MDVKEGPPEVVGADGLVVEGEVVDELDAPVVLVDDAPVGEWPLDVQPATAKATAAMSVSPTARRSPRLLLVCLPMICPPLVPSAGTGRELYPAAVVRRGSLD